MSDPTPPRGLRSAFEQIRRDLMAAREGIEALPAIARAEARGTPAEPATDDRPVASESDSPRGTAASTSITKAGTLVF
jgi:hypothetical protein